MNCSNCGRHKQKQNLLDGVCRTCRREGAPLVVVTAEELLSMDFSSEATEPDYIPSENAQPEGQDLPLDAFSDLHHNQQTKYLKERGVEWKPGEDRLELFKSLG